MLEVVAILAGVGFAIYLFVSALLFERKIKKKLKGKEFRLLKDGIAYIYSPSCGICMGMKPRIEELGKSFKVLMIDISNQDGQKVIQELGISVVPLTLYVKAGIIKNVVAGIIDVEKFLKEISYGDIPRYGKY
ncbi:MAG: thioredoxin family protein [Aquificaceae bacterium]